MSNGTREESGEPANSASVRRQQVGDMSGTCRTCWEPVEPVGNLWNMLRTYGTCWGPVEPMIGLSFRWNGGQQVMRDVGNVLYLPPDIAGGAYFHGKGVYFLP